MTAGARFAGAGAALEAATVVGELPRPAIAANTSNPPPTMTATAIVSSRRPNAGFRDVVAVVAGAVAAGAPVVVIAGAGAVADAVGVAEAVGGIADGANGAAAAGAGVETIGA